MCACHVAARGTFGGEGGGKGKGGHCLRAVNAERAQEGDCRRQLVYRAGITRTGKCLFQQQSWMNGGENSPDENWMKQPLRLLVLQRGDVRSGYLAFLAFPSVLVTGPGAWTMPRC